MNTYAVEIIETETGDSIHRIECSTSYNDAEKVERGVNINLNHAKFHTEIRYGISAANENPA